VRAAGLSTFRLGGGKSDAGASVGRSGNQPTVDMYVPRRTGTGMCTRQALAVCVGSPDRGGMHLGRDVCTWGSEGGGDAPGGAHLGL